MSQNTNFGMLTAAEARAITEKARRASVFPYIAVPASAAMYGFKHGQDSDMWERDWIEFHVAELTRRGV